MNCEKRIKIIIGVAVGSVEMAQLLKALDILAEDLSMVLSTLTWWLITHYISRPGF